MSGMAEYVYAKISGKLAKSFVGRRAMQLFSAKNLSELWTLVFDTDAPLVPEALLAKQIEQNAEKRFIKEFCSLLTLFDAKEPVSLQLLREYDCANLKKINFALATTKPKTLQDLQLTDIGAFSEIQYGAYPNLAKMTSCSAYNWYKEIAPLNNAKSFEKQLDETYVRTLLDALDSYGADERAKIANLVQEELILQNCIWAMRLRTYYKMNKDEVLQNILWRDERNKKDLLAYPVIKTLNFALDSFADWQNWRYAHLLNDVEPDGTWQLDPRFVQRRALLYLNNQALKMIHRLDSSSLVLIAWFKIKQHEIDCIRTAAEALLLNVDKEQAKEFALIKAE